jgi:CBS domain containing-hemolysin-like protein
MNIDEGKFLANHVQWLIEREDAAADSFSTRAGVLLGGIGVELAFLVTIENTNLAFRYALISLVLLVVSAILLLISMIPRRIAVGNSGDFAAVVSGERDATYTIVEHLVKYFDQANRPLNRYRLVSRFRGRWFMSGLISFLAAQIMIAVAFLMGGNA